ncbi:hypothetical protein ACFWZM_30330, partial [[Kitasatospora] papulosa]
MTCTSGRSALAWAPHRWAGSCRTRRRSRSSTTAVTWAALAAGRPDRRPLFTGADGTKLLWSDGRREEADAIVLATGYRPHLPC